MLFFVCGIRLFTIATDKELSEAAVSQSTKRLTVADLRGTIFDCNGMPLTNVQQREVTVVFPSDRGALALTELLSGEELEKAISVLRKGTPVIAGGVVKNIIGGTEQLTVPVRYNGSLEHIIGYLDDLGHGVSGIEKGFDDLLFSKEGLSVSYTTDSNGRMIEGLGWTVNEDKPLGNVTLTVDGKLQRIAENAMQGVKAGATVILDAKNGNLKAVVSSPQFSPDNLSDSLDAEDSPFINRALYSYNVGSVFKPLMALAAIENGLGGYKYTCKGSIVVDGIEFRCNKWQGHGEVDLKAAIAHSCNTYFYTLALELGAKNVYDTVNRFRFDSKLEIGGGIVSSSGAVPKWSSLENSLAALINLSIGQGDLMITPIGIANLYAAIVNGGEYYLPTVVKEYQKNGETLIPQTTPPTKAMDSETAAVLKEYLKNALQYGTGNTAFIEGVSAGGKTGTAQTGWKKDGRSVLNGWFCGFLEGKTTDYVIVILKEDVKSGSYDCAPIFREITLKMHSLGY